MATQDKEDQAGPTGGGASDPPAPTLSIGRSVAAIVLGLFVALMGLAVSFAQGMMTAPSDSAELVALAIVAAGGALALLGFASLFVHRLRRSAGRAAFAVAALLAALFVIDKIALTIQSWNG